MELYELLSVLNAMVEKAKKFDEINGSETTIKMYVDDYWGIFIKYKDNKYYHEDIHGTEEVLRYLDALVIGAAVANGIEF